MVCGDLPCASQAQGVGVTCAPLVSADQLSARLPSSWTRRRAAALDTKRSVDKEVGLHLQQNLSLLLWCAVCVSCLVAYCWQGPTHLTSSRVLLVQGAMAASPSVAGLDLAAGSSELVAFASGSTAVTRRPTSAKRRTSVLKVNRLAGASLLVALASTLLLCYSHFRQTVAKKQAKQGRRLAVGGAEGQGDGRQGGLLESCLNLQADTGYPAALGPLHEGGQAISQFVDSPTDHLGATGPRQSLFPPALSPWVSAAPHAFGSHHSHFAEKPSAQRQQSSELWPLHGLHAPVKSSLPFAAFPPAATFFASQQWTQPAGWSALQAQSTSRVGEPSSASRKQLAHADSGGRPRESLAVAAPPEKRGREGAVLEITEGKAIQQRPSHRGRGRPRTDPTQPPYSRAKAAAPALLGGRAGGRRRPLVLSKPASSSGSPTAPQPTSKGQALFQLVRFLAASAPQEVSTATQQPELPSTSAHVDGSLQRGPSHVQQEGRISVSPPLAPASSLEYHVFYRLPVVEEGEVRVSFNQGLAFGFARICRSLAEPLGIARRLLAQERLTVADSELLIRACMNIASNLWHEHCRGVTSKDEERAAELLGQRYLAFEALLCTGELLGPAMNVSRWWYSLADRVPAGYLVESTPKKMRGFAMYNLAKRLGKAVEKLKRGERPSLEETVGLKRSLFSLSPYAFRKSEWNDWQAYQALYSNVG
ncbi:hypothetical protein Efla_002552 [Eimeria flavescens]